MSTADLEPRERAYVEGLPADEQAVVLPTLLRYRRTDRLGVGDRLPELDLYRLEDGQATPLRGLSGSDPLVLVFGSFT